MQLVGRMFTMQLVEEAPGRQLAMDLFRQPHGEEEHHGGWSSTTTAILR